MRRDAHAAVELDVMRPFKRRSTSPSREPESADRLRPTQLEHTMRYGWRGLPRETVRETLRDDLASAAASSAEHPAG